MLELAALIWITLHPPHRVEICPGALYFYNYKMMQAPSWTRHRHLVCTIGPHRFYKD